MLQSQVYTCVHTYVYIYTHIQICNLIELNILVKKSNNLKLVGICS